MLLPDGSATLMDFGIAWVASEGDGNTGGPTSFQGSPSYMSPEQVTGQPVDHRSDIYALAITLYEAAAGRRAVEGESIPEITHKVATEYPPPPAGLPPFFQTILLRAMAKDPATRYHTASEMANDLRAGRTPMLPLSVMQASSPVLGSSSTPRAYLGATPEEVAAAGRPAPPPATSENWMPPAIPLRSGPAPSVPAPPTTGAQTLTGTDPVTGLLTCRVHPAMAGVARCAECGSPLCYHCLLETPSQGVICRSCGFRGRGPTAAQI